MTVIKDSLCANFECQHGAKCKIVNKRPKCECYPAWGGRHCEQLLVQPVATSTETEDTTSSSVLPRIWTETITENSVEVRIKKFFEPFGLSSAGCLKTKADRKLEFRAQNSVFEFKTQLFR